MKEEVRGLLTEAGVGKMSMRPVKRRYAFEDRAVAPGEQWVLKVKYPGNLPALPAGLTGAPRALDPHLRGPRPESWCPSPKPWRQPQAPGLGHKI